MKIQIDDARERFELARPAILNVLEQAGETVPLEDFLKEVDNLEPLSRRLRIRRKAGSESIITEAEKSPLPDILTRDIDQVLQTEPPSPPAPLASRLDDIVRQARMQPKVVDAFQKLSAADEVRRLRILISGERGSLKDRLPQFRFQLRPFVRELVAEIRNLYQSTASPPPEELGQIDEQLAGQVTRDSVLPGLGQLLEVFDRDVTARPELRDALDAQRRSQLTTYLEVVLVLREKREVVEQAILLIDQLYAHLPFKQARYAVNPVQRLRLLSHRLPELTEGEFHAEMIRTFSELRDAHTVYELPDPYRGSVAFLPFLMTYHGRPGKRRFVVTRTLPGLEHKYFKRGAEITHWNGIPVEQAVSLIADREWGSNPAARFRFGLARMTTRPLRFSLPPEELAVIIRYNGDGEPREIIVPWRVFRGKENNPFRIATKLEQRRRDPASDGIGQSLNSVLDETNQARRGLHLTELLKAEVEMCKKREGLFAQGRTPYDDGAAGLEYESLFPAIFEYWHGRFRTRKPALQRWRSGKKGKRFGYIRIRTFNRDHGEFFDEFVRILGEMEKFARDGLIIDVRGNGGGIIRNGERILQLLTPRQIQPQRFHILNTPLMRKVAERLSGSMGSLVARAEIQPVLNSIRAAVETGEVLSSGQTLTSTEEANDTGQKYYGPVLLLVDALCYSTTDMFAAGFQDHRIGTIIGVDSSTGAGGANVWNHAEQLVPLLGNLADEIQPLTDGTRMTVAFRRCVRAGLNADRPVEDVGVMVPEQDVHIPTPKDALEDDFDLLSKACGRLAQQECRRLEIVEREQRGNDLHLTFKIENLARWEFFREGRIEKHNDLEVRTKRKTRRVSISVADVPATGGAKLRIDGFDEEGKLAASARMNGEP